MRLEKEYEIVDVTFYESNGCMECDTLMTRRKFLIRHKPSGQLSVYDSCLGCLGTSLELK